MTLKTIVCLANSRKLSGRCVAGIELDRSVWIRPVSDREHREVSEYERHYENGSDPKVLDVITVPLLRPLPESYQSENWLLDPARYWRKRKRRVRWSELAPLADDRPLWLEGSSSTYHGLNDRLTLELADRMRDSLRLIHVAELELQVFAPGRDFGNPKRRVQAHFAHRDTHYRLWVTDPLVVEEYLAMPDGSYSRGDAYLTVSLGEPYDGHVYKLVAAVITRARVSRGESHG